MSGLRIKTEHALMSDKLITYISYLKINEYEVGISLMHPFTAEALAEALASLSQSILEKEEIT